MVKKTKEEIKEYRRNYYQTRYIPCDRTKFLSYGLDLKNQEDKREYTHRYREARSNDFKYCEACQKDVRYMSWFAHCRGLKHQVNVDLIHDLCSDCSDDSN
jgi:hypothetical protein